jgi:hypothetical protein
MAETPPEQIPKKTAGKTGNWIKDHKTIVIILGVAAGALVVYFLFHANGSASNAASQNQAGVDPATGIPWSQETGGGGGIPGPTGPAGPPGPPGKPGPRGKPGKKPRPKPKPKPGHHHHGTGGPPTWDKHGPPMQPFGVGQFRAVRPGEVVSPQVRALNPNTSSFHAGVRVRTG